MIGSDRPLLGLVDYVHLNPVRAGICPLSELKAYALSSYPKYFELNEGMWDQLVADRIAAAGKTEADVAGDRKGAVWKVQIARELRAKTTAGNIWIARRLNMGHPFRVTNLIRNA